MAEILWLIILFPIPSNMTPALKRETLKTIWSWSGDKLDLKNPFFEDPALEGIGSSGGGYNQQRWRELVFLISALQNFKNRDADDRSAIASDPWIFSDWLCSLPGARNRQFTHILRHLLFPDSFENISFEKDKRLVLEGYDIAPEEEIRKWSLTEIDRQLLNLRRQLEKVNGEEWDFYEEPFKSQWKNPKDQIGNRMKVVLFDESGDELDATVIEGRVGDWIEYIIESRGGSHSSGNVRNPHYIPALESLLRSLKQGKMVLQDILVASKELENSPLPERRVQLDKQFPINLVEEDIAELRLEICNSMATVGSKRTTGHRGIPTRRLCIIVSHPYSNLPTTDADTPPLDSANSSTGVTGPPPSGTRSSTERNQSQGSVYVAKLNGIEGEVIKIGFTSNTNRRIHQLNKPLLSEVTGINWELCEILTFPTERQAYEHEQELHRNLKRHLVRGEREIYNADIRATESFHDLILAHNTRRI